MHQCTPDDEFSRAASPGATTKPITAPVKTSSRGWVDVRRSGVNATYPDFLSPLLAMGAGLGLITAPATTAIVAATPVEKHGVAAAVNDAICEIGAAIGVAVAGSVLTAGYVYRIQPVLPTVPSPAHQPLSDSLAAALQVAEQPGPCAQHLADIAREAIAHGKAKPLWRSHQSLPSAQSSSTPGHAAVRPQPLGNAWG